jgi:hypothetical protein
MLRKMLVTMLVLGAAAGITSLGSALFTDSQAVTANTFTAGTVEISTNPTTALVTFSNMAPGDSVTAPITVSNGSSTLDLRYAISSVTTEDVLAAELELTVYSGVTALNCAARTLGAGTVLYGPAIIGSVAGTNVIGNPAAGNQGGERTLLAADADEILCFDVALPLGTTVGQGVTSTATFTFAAEQTKNN